MDTVLLLPIADAGPNDGQPTPGSPASHWDKVDDDPNDGDTSFVTIIIAGGEEAFTWDASALSLMDVIPELRVRWAVVAGATDYLVRAGLMINGLRYYGPDRMPGIGTYTIYEESFLVDPVDGAAWTAARVQRAGPITQHVQIGSDLPRPRFSEIVGLASRIAPPFRPTATDISQASSAGASPIGPGSVAGASGRSTATPAAIVPSTAMTSLTPTATPRPT